MSENRNMPKNLLEWLLLIELRPGMYLGCKDLMALSHFVAGYQTAKLEQGIDGGEWLDSGFRPWLARRYKDSRSLGWCDLILCNEVLYREPERALSRFYQLLHLYLEENHGTEQFGY